MKGRYGDRYDRPAKRLRAEIVGAPLYFSHPASFDHETGDHPERPARITAIEGELERRGWCGYERREAPPASREVLTAVHTPEYLDGVRALSDAGGGALDEDTVVSPGSYGAALGAAGAAIAMTAALLDREARVAFCGTRPPGHHARRDTTSGFCLVNNVAVGARHALDQLGARRVFIVDWDVHHGDGTNDIFRASDAVLFASIHEARAFPGTGPLEDVGVRAGEGFSINLPVPPAADEDAWVSLLEHVVIPAATEFEPDLVLISAGYDAHRDDEQGGCELDAGSFAEMARHVRALAERVGAPVGAVLEGGYALDALGTSVAATLTALAGDEEPDSVSPDFLTSRAASHIGHYWTL
jgi:acetoin utilization deacetylase AcuC-like enzyme